MTQLSRAQWVTSYEDATTGAFPTNTSQAIGANDLQACMTDLSDSFTNKTDDIKSSPTASEQMSSDSNLVNLWGNGAFRTSSSISSADILTSNATPVTLVAAPGAGYVIFPLAFFLHLDYNSIAYATNTTFRFEINGTAVSSNNTTLLTEIADGYSIMYPIDVSTDTNLKNAALVFKTQTGNPTAGNSPIYFTVIYRIVPTAAEV